MTRPDPTRKRPCRAARAGRGLLAALVGVLLVLAGIVVGAVPAAAQNRVGAWTPAVIDTVGVSTGIDAVQRRRKTVPQPQIVVATGVAAETSTPLIKAGSEGGPTAGMTFPESVRQQEFAYNPSTCVYCRMETDSPQIDHAVPRWRGGNATIDNAQTTCGWCNASNGARDFPANPPPGFAGGWPPPWRGSLFW
jgi:5-methylcytosine-specific restriction endonuclease McrA